jgi:hypothetical protein
MTRKKRNILIFIGILSLLGVCIIIAAIIWSNTPEGRASSTQLALTPSLTQFKIPTTIPIQTIQIEATKTISPTDTPGPTSIPIPTETPGPTNTSVLTKNPEPTLTSTPLPGPVKLSGKGDSVVDIDMKKIGGIGIAHIIGNKSSSFFAVQNYDAAGKRIDLLVNTTDPYDGYVPLDFLDGQHTTRLEINATGDWTIELIPLQSGHELKVPGTLKGKGDEVLLLRGGKPDTVKIVGNKSSGFFAVQSYDLSGYDLLVNTTDPYDGTVILSRDAIILVIKASDDWTIEIKSK